MTERPAQGFTITVGTVLRESYTVGDISRRVKLARSRIFKLAPLPKEA